MNKNFEKQDDGSYIVQLGKTRIRGVPKSKQNSKSFLNAIMDLNLGAEFKDDDLSFEEKYSKIEETINVRNNNGDNILLSEFGHPKFNVEEPLCINLENVCCKITNIVISEDNVFGKFTPFGPKKKLLEDFINNTPEEVAFGLRAIISKDDVINSIVKIITWDFIPKSNLQPYIE